MNEKILFRKSWTALTILLVIINLYLCLAPMDDSPPLFDFPHLDKLGHLLPHCLIAFLLTQLYPSKWRRAFLGTLSYGIIIEYLQGFSGYRTFDYFDMLANGVGALIGIFLSLKPFAGLIIKLENLILFRK